MTIKTSADESINRLAEEQLYVKVSEELSTGRTREGIWFKALAESEGDITKAKALYVKYRVQSLKDELVIEQQVQKNIDNDAKIHGLKLILAIIIKKSPRAIRYIVSIICWGYSVAFVSGWAYEYLLGRTNDLGSFEIYGFVAISIGLGVCGYFAWPTKYKPPIRH
mgnify:FL=1